MVGHKLRWSWWLVLSAMACADPGGASAETGATSSDDDSTGRPGTGSVSDDNASVTSATPTPSSETGDASGSSSSGDTSGGGVGGSSESSSTGPGLSPICGADPCGGDLVGEWTYSTLLCTEPVVIHPDHCPEADRWVYTDVEGTLEFVADGTTILHRRGVSLFRDLMPKACLGPAGCGTYGPSYTCVEDDLSCDCTAEIFGEWIDEIGTYEVEGTTLLDDDGNLEFCAMPDALALIHLETAEWTYLVR